MSHQNKIIDKVLAYIEVNLEGDLRLDTVADAAGYSKFHLNRMFTEEVGCTIHKFIRQRRLAQAAEKLTGSDKPIAEIAFEARYESQQAFTLAFRQAYRYPPQVYRTRRACAPAPVRTMLLSLYGRKGGIAA